MMRLGMIMLFGLLAAFLFVFSGGGHSEEIQHVRDTQVKSVKNSGSQSSESIAKWIDAEFYFGRFEVRWSADEITDGNAAGQVRVSANLRSNSVKQLEQSVVLQFNVNPENKQVVFVGMILEGDEIMSPSGKPYSLQGAVKQMWELRGKALAEEMNLTN